MILFEKRFHDGLTSGAITLTFRRWASARVKPGGRYRCHPIGVLEVDAVQQVRVRELTEKDAQRAGFDSLAQMREYLSRGAPLKAADALWRVEFHRVEFHHGGDGDRVQLALESKLSAEDLAAIDKALARMDSKRAWTAETLAAIDGRPQVAASKLAAALGRETLPFKVDVRRLKKLGLTQSFEVGYELSPRGRAYWTQRGRKRSR
jgi:hypothetical protein